MPKGKESYKVIRDALIGAVIAQVVQLIFLSVSNVQVNNPELGQWAPYILTAFVSIAVGVIIYIILIRREEVRRSNWPMAFFLGDRHPAGLIATGRVEKFGVHWDIEYGWNDDSLLSQMNRTAKIRAYADGPFCPLDHCRLTALSEPTFFGGEKNIWRCAKCGTVFKRPKETYGREDNEVEKVAMVEHENWVKKNPQ